MPRDDFVTNTVEDAARFERMYGPEYDDDRPTLADLYEPPDDEEAEDDDG
jgi:hypothetical protein